MGAANHVSFGADDDLVMMLSELEKALGCSRSEVIRRAIFAFNRAIHDEESAAVSGDLAARVAFIFDRKIPSMLRRIQDLELSSQECCNVLRDKYGCPHKP